MVSGKWIVEGRRATAQRQQHNNSAPTAQRQRAVVRKHRDCNDGKISQEQQSNTSASLQEHQGGQNKRSDEAMGRSRTGHNSRTGNDRGQSRESIATAMMGHPRVINGNRMGAASAVALVFAHSAGSPREPRASRTGHLAMLWQTGSGQGCPSHRGRWLTRPGRGIRRRQYYDEQEGYSGQRVAPL